MDAIVPLWVSSGYVTRKPQLCVSRNSLQNLGLLGMAQKNDLSYGIVV